MLKVILMRKGQIMKRGSFQWGESRLQQEGLKHQIVDLG